MTPARLRRNSALSVWLRDFAPRHPPTWYRQRNRRALCQRLALGPAALSEFPGYCLVHPIPARHGLSTSEIGEGYLAEAFMIHVFLVGSTSSPAISPPFPHCDFVPPTIPLVLQKHPAGEHIRRLQRHDVIRRQHYDRDRRQDDWPDATARGRARFGSSGHLRTAAGSCAARCIGAKASLAVGAETVVHVAAASVRRWQEFIIGIVREIDVVGDAGAEAGIAGEKLVHPVAVAGEDHHQILAL